MVYSSYKYNVHEYVAMILVNMDLLEGLIESVDVDMGDWEYTQILDYVNVPF